MIWRLLLMLALCGCATVADAKVFQEQNVSCSLLLFRDPQTNAPQLIASCRTLDQNGEPVRSIEREVFKLLTPQQKTQLGNIADSILTQLRQAETIPSPTPTP